MEFHEIADIFPLMEGMEFENLVEDIRKHGLLEPIVEYEKKILDGRNRFRACQKVGVKPCFIHYEGNDPLSYVISKNLKRRHLNESQRAIIAAKLANMPPHRPTSKSANLPTYLQSSANLRKVIPQPQAARMLNVSERSIRSVKQIEREAPELLSKIETGQLRVGEAIKELKKAKRQAEIERQEKEIKEGKINSPVGKYEIIVIDPPWPYASNYDPDGFRGTTDYPEMSIEALKKLKIPCTENSVIFLWTTHKFIWNAKELLDIWGFIYRNILVWDKEKMGIGKLFRLQCEFCLVGLKGKPLFKDNHSERDIILEPRREHSRKPEAFYNMVDRLCVGRKLDIFGREKRNGWDIWGIEKWDNSKLI